MVNCIVACLLVTEGLQQQPSNGLKPMLRFVSSKSHTCSAAPHMLFYKPLCQVNELVLLRTLHSQAWFRLDCSSSVLSKRRTRYSHSTVGESIAETKRYAQEHHLQWVWQKGHLGALYGSTAWCPMALQGVNTLTFSYFGKHILFSKFQWKPFTVAM